MGAHCLQSSHVDVVCDEEHQNILVCLSFYDIKFKLLSGCFLWQSTSRLFVLDVMRSFSMMKMNARCTMMKLNAYN